MSLFHLIRRYLLIALLTILVIGSMLIFFVFKIFIHYTTDQTLYDYRARVENYIQLHDSLSIFKPSLQTSLPIESKIIEHGMSYNEGITDTLLYDEGSGYFQPYRRLSFVASYNSKPHLITINQPTINLDDLFYVIIGSLGSLFIILFIFIYLIDSYLKRKVWSHFYKTLTILRDYNLTSAKVLEFEITGVKEFDELNATAQKMSDKISADYQNIKLFTEDISHEMQTPLAIIKSKLEILMQNDPNDERTLSSMKSISNATTRLSKLSTSLLLITKINNNQFTEVSKIDLNKLLDHYLDSLEELIEMKNIRLNLKIDKSEHYINETLAEILISNILSNAIRHNINGGFIKITLNQNVLELENSCEKVNLADVPNLFGRLICKKSEYSTGLGLSIVKSICDQNHYKVEYTYPQEDVFILELRF